MGDCIFCNIDPSLVIAETERMLAFRDTFPVTECHTLIIPKKHKKDAFELGQEETNELFLLIHRLRASILEQDQSVTGFNIGMNCGESAGQTVFHCHVHLIPRRDGDCENPRGGVRGVISSKQRY
jgi:diadenosine tetraphosphate (Ap4A) HIT family hydrolase